MVKIGIVSGPASAIGIQRGRGERSGEQRGIREETNECLEQVREGRRLVKKEEGEEREREREQSPPQKRSLGWTLGDGK